MEKTALVEPEYSSETKDGIATLILNRPETLNSLTATLLDGLTKALRHAEKDQTVCCAVLAGAGRAFCAGADLEDLKRRRGAKPVSLGDDLREHFNPLIQQMRKMEKPIVGAINGLAAGAGVSLMLACDVKVCAEDAKFINAFAKVGLVPDSGMTWFMPRSMGLSLALEHAWLAKPVTARRALELGWVNELVPAAQALEKAQALAAELAQMPPRSLALTKRALNHALECGLEEQMEYEAQLQEILGKTKDHAEGVAAFLEKRKPVFKGE